MAIPLYFLVQVIALRILFVSGGKHMLSSKTFDPYHKWLGIRPEEQPANYYRLLGIALFEDDADAIAGAADQRMAHVRSFQTGNYAALSQRILNEIAAARVCLLTPQKKTAYDQALQARFTPPSPPVMPPMVVETDGIPDMGFATAHRNQHKKSTPFWMPWAFVGVGGLVAVIILTVIAKSGRDEQAVAKTPTTTMPQPISPKSELKKVEPKVEAKPQPKDREKVDSEPIADAPSSEKTEPAEDSDPLPEVKAPNGAEVRRTVNPKLVVHDNSAPLPEAETPKTKEPAKPQPEQPFKEKLPIPDDAAQEKVMATIRDIYKDDYKDRTALANKLFQRATETQDTAERFVLLYEAKSLASETWQGKLAFDVIDVIAKEYEISGPSLKVEVFEQVVKKPRISPEQKIAIAKAALEVIDEAIGEDKFDVAKKAGRIASQLVRQTNNKDLLQEIVAKGKDVGTAAKAYADAQKAMATLKGIPDDPEANLIVGKYLCFNKGNWKKGLPMLAKGSDDTFKALATKDIAGAANANEQVKLGDAWWDVAKDRAAQWYRQAVPQLTGLEKDKVQKRLQYGNSFDRQKTKRVIGEIFAACDNRFVMYVNGVRVLDGGEDGASTTHEFSRGDLITVQAIDDGVITKGFCCVIKMQTGEVIVSGPTWSTYVPKSSVEWYKSIGVVMPIQKAGATRPVIRVQEASGITGASIWGQENPCCLLYKYK